MKKLTTLVLGITLLASSTLFAGSNIEDKTESISIEKLFPNFYTESNNN